MIKNALPREDLEKRTHPKKEDIRGCYYRDQTAIIHSRPFRRLKHKTQVFFSPEDDHVCTRIEHVLHVASIAATICRGLNVSQKPKWELSEDLAYSIGLGHDLGHTPFGHTGENVLDHLLGGGNSFIHEVNSYRVVEKLAAHGKGLNLTYAVKDGIIFHNGEEFKQNISPDHKLKDLNKINDRKNVPATYEGCIVRFSDKIAYLGRDVEDAILAGFITKNEIPRSVRKRIGTSNGEIINYFILDLIHNSSENNISFSKECHELMKELKEFNYKAIYNHPRLKEYERFCKRIITVLYEHLTELYCSNYWDLNRRCSKEALEVNKNFGSYLYGMWNFYETERREMNWTEKELREQIIVDYISGMTDQFAINCMQEISIPAPIEFGQRTNYPKRSRLLYFLNRIYKQIFFYHGKVF